MKERYEVEVTQQDCDEGCRGTERYCVVATAIMRLIPEATRIEVNVNTIRFSIIEDGKRERVAFPTPPQVGAYIIAYDAGTEPTPMKFLLEHPQIVEKSPRPEGVAKAPSFKPGASPKTHRAIRVFGEKSFVSR